MGISTSLAALKLLALVQHVRAAEFPAPLSGAHAQLKEEDGVTFDPLGVAAVLYNPRADKSAARLYIQYDSRLFIWPHMTMIGGTLPAMQMLVERLTATFKWIHPAIKMCAKDTTMLPVRSDVSGNVFRQLPLNLSNLWLSEIISFPTSALPGNDFAIVCVDTVHEPAKEGELQVRAQLGNVWWRVGSWALNLMCLVNGAMLITGTVFGMVLADLWAFSLFSLYTCHWGVSVLISLNPMVNIHKPQRVQEDFTVRYAVYEREEGGTVIFKGPQKKLEEWARSTWEYKPTRTKDCLHWLWVITGTLCGVASVACMVNMYGSLQLGFLAVLVYASVAEIGATRIARILQTKAHGTIHKAEATDNQTRTQAIIRATLAVRPECRLAGLDWIKMGLLPPMQLFQDMQDLLKSINRLQTEDDMKISPAEVGTECLAFMRKLAPGASNEILADRIRREIWKALFPRQEPPSIGEMEEMAAQISHSQ
ncbi:hypothetical protein N7492_004169 [Penicillium capsulatum]|uniref:Uncharacterized protein n=1 Tax=Penicillium capsulatum TaxID=69766 RepID=A0A9W9IKZ3_9EURO|nr:hypothetical protein N7492_004169 [Penicillium capsulatum]KAJ6121261.1 hypothetical protein N7512_003726 [Penicillium capsulatum]